MLRALLRTILIALPMAGLSGVSCGGSSSPASDSGAQVGGSSSGVAGTKTIGILTDAEKKQFCDWTAGLYGGYGNTVTCPAATTIVGPASQSACLAVSAMIPSSCTATVAQAESCTKTMATCDTGMATADCMALYTCYPSGLSP